MKLRSKTYAIGLFSVLTASTAAHAVVYPTATAAYSVTTATLPIAPPSTNYVPSAFTDAAIQTAINTASAAGGGIVKLNSGVYTINAPVILKSNITLKGNGQGITILRRGSSFVYPTGSTSLNTSILKSSNAALHDVSIIDLTVDGDFTPAQLAANLPGLYCVWITSDATASNHNIRIRLHNSEVTGCGIGFGFSGTTHVTLSGGSYHHNGGSHIWHNIYGRRVGYVNVQGITSSYSTGSGIKIAGGTSNYAGESTNVLVEDSVLVHNAYNGMYIAGSDRVRIANNQIDSDETSGADSTGNAGGIILRDESSLPSQHVDVVNNMVQNNTYNGIKIWNSDLVNVQGNRCNTNGTNYNLVTSTNVTIDYNTI